VITQNDRLSEIIAHFIGYFDVKVAQMRVKDEYEGFRAASEEDTVEDAQIGPAPLFAHPYELESSAPGFHYAGPDWTIRGDSPAHILPIKAVPPPAPEIAHSAPLPSSSVHEISHEPGWTLPVLHGPDPGSVAVVLDQRIVLDDHDVIALTARPLRVDYHFGATEKFEGLVTDGAAVGDSFVSPSPVGSSAAMRDLVLQAEAATTAAPSAGPAHVVATGHAATGTFVNGALADEAPALTDALPERLLSMTPDAPESAGADTQVISGESLEASMTLEAGGNYSGNEVQIFNAGLTGTAIAVLGDVHQLDAVVQTNIRSDMDVDGTGLAKDEAATVAINLASFGHTAMDAGEQAAALNPGILPLTWQISVVDGDVMFMDWVRQYTYVSDSDVAVLNGNGSITTIVAGGNVSGDSAALLALGMDYDLILIGGNLYDANIVVQTNVLYDDDTLVTLAGSAALAGDVKTGGNLLWNEASIVNYGAQAWQQGVPHHYGEAVDTLASGGERMPAGLSSDHDFEGLQVVRTLFVSGNLYDIRYVEQTNIVADADYVAVHQRQVLDSAPSGKWHLSTGENALVNIATIHDYDSLGEAAYAEGDVYSDAILIQADLIDTGPQAPHNELAAEVVAFLDDAPDIPSTQSDIHVSGDAPTVDVLQSMLA
jgi:hypothetical protein